MEPGFAKGVWIVWRNSLGCELDRDFVKEKSDGNYTSELASFVTSNSRIFDAGDTVSLEEGETEVE